MTIETVKDVQTMTPTWDRVEIEIQGVHLQRSRHLLTRNGHTTEYFRNDWPHAAGDVAHVLVNFWDKPIVSDWHFHKLQTDHLCVLQGRVLCALVDARKESPTYNGVMKIRMDAIDPLTVSVPPGVLHAFRVIKAPSIVVNAVTHVYDYEDPDHWRVARKSLRELPDLESLE